MSQSSNPTGDGSAGNGASSAILGENTAIGGTPVARAGFAPAAPAAPGNSPSGAPVVLSPSQPSVTTNAPMSSVEVSVPNKSGPVVFSLVVTDNLGVKSQPAYATVTIQSPPVAVLAASPATVTAGGKITLSGAGSTTSGSLASYTFSLVPAAG